ncbi:hypothetical protein [Marivita hallyeonensis]|uniref:Uncharacterized protein n=1 Tax=Marivita hallyeonensis TaxID=996342 RepID=A0A1M5R5S2_9RHOB|nr:hypothetical protein [Marivita hallyeonensis]SHH21551.1 hypothetical protein SAMN05443551_1627 [Marivita hallyeonensis]
MTVLQLLRMAKWARHPVSLGRVKLVLVIALICLTVFVIERWVGWPAWMLLDAERVPNRVVR